MKEILTIVKLGGKVINDDMHLSSFLNAFSKLSGNKLLVHGGGNMATELAKRLGLKVNMINGRRITDNEMLNVVTMSYGGLINKKIVSMLQGVGCNALGLTGADGNLILSVIRPKKKDVDYGWVGDPKTVNHKLIINLLSHQITPIIAPLTHDGNGHMLNTNADTIASIMAITLSEYFEVNLVFAFEHIGVLTDISDNSSLVHLLTEELYAEMKEAGKIFDGMLPKLDNAFNAKSKGVSSVRIGHFNEIDQLTNKDFHGYTIIK